MTWYARNVLWYETELPKNSLGDNVATHGSHLSESLFDLATSIMPRMLYTLGYGNATEIAARSGFVRRVESIKLRGADAMWAMTCVVEG